MADAPDAQREPMAEEGTEIMSKDPTPKADALRAMREAQFSATSEQRKPTKALREAVAAIPAKKARKAKRHGK